MKLKMVVLTLSMMIGSLAFANVRPGTSIKASIKSSNKADLAKDLKNLDIDESRAADLLKAVDTKIISDDQLSSLLSRTDSEAQKLVKIYVSDLVPAALAADANNVSVSSLTGGDSVTKGIREIQKIASLIIQSKDNKTLNMSNMPAIMAIVKEVAAGRMDEAVANSRLISDKLVNLEEGADALKALRDC